MPDPDEWMALNHHDYSSNSPNSEPEVDAAGPQVNTGLQYGMYHVYLFMQGCFQRLRHLMATDHSMQGRGNLLRILRNYERNGITTGEADHMTFMHRSISEMKSVVLERGGSILAIQDEGQGRIYQDFADNSVWSPKWKSLQLDAVPDAGQPGSPESKAMWMIRSLTRRIVMSCLERRPAMFRYMAIWLCERPFEKFFEHVPDLMSTGLEL